MRRRRAGLLIAYALVALVLIVEREPMRNLGDPLGLLLGTEALLSSGTIALDGFGQERIEQFGYRVREIGGQHYHFFPYGTALLALPAVAVANLLGYSVSDVGVDRVIQNAMIWIAFLLWSVALYRIARRYLAETHAMAASALVVWSTMLSSSGLTGLFSHDYALVFALFAIERALAVADAPGTGRAARAGAAAGLLAVGAYVCRPTFLAFLPLLLAFVALQGWRAALLGLLGAAAGGLVFLGLNQALFGVWLPPYFALSRIGGGLIGEALIGYLVSPGPGILVYLPFLILALATLRAARPAFPPGGSCSACCGLRCISTRSAASRTGGAAGPSGRAS